VHSVLQAGTAVLVDRYGVPRARCACGNPLTPPTPARPAEYTGDRWAAFDPAHVVTVAPTSAPMALLTLVDPVSLAAFTRPVGGNGATDQTRTPTPTPTARPTVAPAPPGPQPPSNSGNPPAKPQRVRVPNVIGQDKDDAKNALQEQGFHVNIDEVDGPGNNTVISTDPRAGSQVRPGSTITLRVSKPAATDADTDKPIVPTTQPTDDRGTANNGFGLLN